MTFFNCDLDENPIFLDAEATYSDLEIARGALDGIYQSMSVYGAQEQRIFAVNGFSGLFVTRKNGNYSNNVNNINLFSLKPTYDRDSDAMWRSLYAAIGRANGAIANINTTESPTDKSDLGFNDIKGQAHLIRAWLYLS